MCQNHVRTLWSGNAPEGALSIVAGLTASPQRVERRVRSVLATLIAVGALCATPDMSLIAQRAPNQPTLTVLVGDSVTHALIAWDDTLRVRWKPYPADLVNALARNICQLHHAGKPDGPIRHLALRVSQTGIGNDTVTLNRTGARCAIESAGSGVIDGEAASVSVLSVAVSEQDLGRSSVRLTLTVQTQIVDRHLDGDTITWMWDEFRGWYLTAYRRGPMDGIPYEPIPLLPIKVIRPPTR